MHPRGHELVHIRSMNWVQSTFITCHTFLFFAQTSLDILGHMTVSSTTLHVSGRADLVSVDMTEKPSGHAVCGVQQ